MDIQIINIRTKTGLSTLAFKKDQKTFEELFALYSSIHRMEKYVMTNEGFTEVSVFVETEYIPIVKNILSTDPVYHQDNMAVISVELGPDMADTPLVFSLLRPIVEQEINIVEYATTRNEVLFFVAEKDQPSLQKILETIGS